MEGDQLCSRTKGMIDRKSVVWNIPANWTRCLPIYLWVLISIRRSVIISSNMPISWMVKLKRGGWHWIVGSLGFWKKVGFDIQVLTAGAWPLNQKEDSKTMDSNRINIPAELEKSVSQFEQFYGQHYSGRKLLWQWNLARGKSTSFMAQSQVSDHWWIGELRVNFLDRPYEIQMGLYQMVLLLLFNDTLSLTVTDIVQQSSLSEADVLRSLKV